MKETATEESASKATESTAEAQPKPKKTDEELQQECDLKVQKWSNLYQETAGIARKTPDGTRYTKEFSAHMKTISSSYFSFKSFPLKILKSGRWETAGALLRSGNVEVLCDIVADEYNSGEFASEDSAVAKNHVWVLRCALSALLNFSDTSCEVTYAIRDHERVLPAVLKLVLDWAPRHHAGELSVSFATEPHCGLL